MPLTTWLCGDPARGLVLSRNLVTFLWYRGNGNLPPSGLGILALDCQPRTRETQVKTAGPACLGSLPHVAKAGADSRNIKTLRLLPGRVGYQQNSSRHYQLNSPLVVGDSSQDVRWKSCPAEIMYSRGAMGLPKTLMVGRLR